MEQLYNDQGVSETLGVMPKKMSMVASSNVDSSQEVDCDDEISAQMTASYSEISFNSGQSPTDISPLCSDIISRAVERPATLAYGRSVAPRTIGQLDLEGTIRVEGNMTHFVAEDLEHKIKLSSPVSKKGDTPPIPGSSRIGTPSTLYRQLLAPQLLQVNVDVLYDLENQAQRIATSIDNLTENLCGILHSISSITADNVDIYKDAVTKMADAMDSNIKSMYTIVAKAEEVTQAMQPVQVHATRIREIKRLVDLFESNM